MKRMIYLITLLLFYNVSCFSQDYDQIANRLARKGIEKLFKKSYDKGEVSKRESDLSIIVTGAALKANGRFEINIEVVWTGGVFNYRYNLKGNLYMDPDGCNTKWRPKEWNGTFMATTKITNQDLECIDSEED
jgi:hypothetical protein